MLSTVRVAIKSLQVQQVRFGHRMRGKAPIFCRTIKERLDELNTKDKLYTTKIDIGFPRVKKPSKEIRSARMEILQKKKTNKELEQLARNQKLEVDMDQVKADWLKTLGPRHKQVVAQHYGVFEHLYGEGFFTPHVNLEVSYDLKDGNVLPVCVGNVIKPKESLEVPFVTYDSDGNDMWTLALTSLDGHLTEADKEYVHWFVANIPGNSIEKGDTLVEYLRPFPLKGTGYHRYVFVLYKQHGRIDYDIPKVTSQTLENRTFITRDWYKQHQDNVTPAGLAFFQADWDETVKEFFHHTLDIKEPVYEYDFESPFVRPQEWFPRQKSFNLYMDRYRDPKKINKEYLLRKLKDEDPFAKPEPPLRFPNAHRLPHKMPSWLKEQERRIRMGWGRINNV